MSVLFAVSLLSPLLLVVLAALRLPAFLLRMLLPVVAVPGCVLALIAAPDFALSGPWLLLGAEWGLRGVRSVFLLLTAALWALGGVYTAWYLQRRLRSFCVGWGLSLVGNLQLVMAADIVGFYTGFAVMSLASYILVVHQRDQLARRAGAVYIAFAILGELLLLAGLLLGLQTGTGLAIDDFVAGVASLPDLNTVVLLLWLGLGVKAAVPLFHLWLPLAHPVAPTPASAVLSAAMVKAGVLGWLLLLPLGQTALPTLGGLIAVAGAAGAWLALIPGVCQRDPKAVLAYSSVSQLGMMAMLVGAALIVPGHAALLSTVAALYAVHHAFAKGALFFSTSLGWEAHPRARWLVCFSVLLPALALIGFPATSGWWMKSAAKVVLGHHDQVAWLLPVFSGSALVTSILMLRLVFLLWPNFHQQAGNPRLLGVTLVTALLAYPTLWWLWQTAPLQALVLPVVQPSWLDGLSMMAFAALIAAAAWRLRLSLPAIPPGDLIALLPHRSDDQSTK